MKKTKYLVAALLLMGATTTFTSCIDNDEPAGITELRGAKAELLKAKAVVEQARAQKVLAEAEYQKALAATELANARYREAEAKLKEAQAAAEEARTEEEKARVEAQIAYYKNLMEEQALIHEKTMVQYQQNLAEAKRQYDLVIKQIEIAEAIMSDKDKVSVGFLKNEVNKAYAIIYGGKYYDEYNIETGEGSKEITVVDQLDGGWLFDIKQSLNGKLFDANEKLYDAMLDKTHGFVDPANDNSVVFIASLENDVEKNKATVEAAENKVTKLENFLKEDVETADWRAEIAELEDSIKTLDVEREELRIQVEEAEASPEYLEAAQAYKGITDKGAVGNPEETNITTINNYKQKGTAQELTLAKWELNTAFANKGITVKEFEVEASNLVKNLVAGNIEENQYNVHLFKVDEISDAKNQFQVNASGDIDYKPGVNTLFNLNLISAWIKAAEKTEADANDEALAELTLEKKQKAEKTAKESYENSVNNKLDKAVDAYNGKVEQADIDATKTDLQKVVDAYTAAHKTLVAAVNKYNTTYKSVYDAGYKAGEEEFESVYREGLFKNATVSSDDVVYQALQTIESQYSVSGLASSFVSVSPVTLKTEATALSLIANLVVDEKEKEAQEKFTKAVDKAVAIYLIEAEDQLKDYATKAANAAVNKSTTDSKGEIKLADDAMDKADKAAIDAFKKIDSAKTTWLDGDVKTILAQIEDTKNVKSLKDITGITGTPNTLVSDNKEKPEVKEVKSTDITPEEFASYTVTKLGDDTLVQSVVSNAAEYVYGDWGTDDYKIVAPSAQEMRDKFGTSLGDEITKGVYVGGTYGAWIKAQDELKACEDAIAATEDLKTLVEDLTKLKADYEAAIEDAKKEAYGEEIKTYEDAIVANEKAKAAFELEEVKVEEISLEVAKIGIKISYLQDVRKELIDAVNKYLGLDDPANYNPNKFEQDLKDALVRAKDDLVVAQENLAKAEKALEDAQNGEYDKVAHCQRVVDDLMAQIAIAQKNYDAALANLETALEIMAKTAE